ncbi:MAG: hypothetical protein AAF824_08000 [Bacteroidota bacterium]
MAHQSQVEIPDEVAWKIFTKGISQEEAKRKVVTTGEHRLGRQVISMLTFMI